MKKRKSNIKSLKIQAIILASSGVITRIIGFLYRIPMANILGNEGNGIYSVAFGIYSIALTLSSYSLPVSISKLLSQKAGNSLKEKNKILIVSFLISLTLSVISFFGLFFGADFLSTQFGKPGIQMSLKILAPTTIVVALLGCLRGYFQGDGDMLPTAVSQIVEQIINAIVSIIGASQLVYLIRMNNDSPVRSAGGTLGTLSGALVALVFLIAIFALRIGVKTLKINIRKVDIIKIGKTLLLLMLPIIFSQTIYQIGYTIDDLLFAKIMAGKGFSTIVITEMQGVINTQYTQIINMPVGIATAFGVAVIPRISKAFAQKNKKDLFKNTTQIFDMTALIIFPATVGLSICSYEVIEVLFPALKSYQTIAAKLLLYGAVAVALYSFSTITTSVLQGCNKFFITVRNGAIALGVHIIIVVILLVSTNLGLYALLIADVVFPLVIVVLNTIYFKRNMDVIKARFNFFLKHLVSTSIMGVVLLLVKLFCLRECESLIKLIIEIIVGIVTYGLAELFIVKIKK